MISKKLRFEVLKRDKFTCQYCGRKAPDVLLEVDHIKPLAGGGEDSILNLVSSCEECNRGKRDIPLSVNQELEKAHKEMAALQARRDQLDELLRWQQSLASAHSDELKAAKNLLKSLTGCSITKYGSDSLRKWLKKWPADQVMNAIRISAEQYSDFEDVFRFIPGIIVNTINEAERPRLKRIYYLRAILRNRFRSVNYYENGQLLALEQSHQDIELWVDFAKSVASKGCFFSELASEIGKEQCEVVAQ